MCIMHSQVFSEKNSCTGSEEAWGPAHPYTRLVSSLPYSLSPAHHLQPEAQRRGSALPNCCIPILSLLLCSVSIF